MHSSPKNKIFCTDYSHLPFYRFVYSLNLFLKVETWWRCFLKLCNVIIFSSNKNILQHHLSHADTRLIKAHISSAAETPSHSGCEEAVLSEVVSSTLKLENSPPMDELSSSPQTEGAGDASGVEVVVLAGEGNESGSSVCCCRLQYIILAVRVRIIFWLTCHDINQERVRSTS